MREYCLAREPQYANHALSYKVSQNFNKKSSIFLIFNELNCSYGKVNLLEKFLDLRFWLYRKNRTGFEKQIPAKFK
jgi:hypothetical protein